MIRVYHEEVLGAGCRDALNADCHREPELRRYDHLKNVTPRSTAPRMTGIISCSSAGPPLMFNQPSRAANPDQSSRGPLSDATAFIRARHNAIGSTRRLEPPVATTMKCWPFMPVIGAPVGFRGSATSRRPNR